MSNFSANNRQPVIGQMSSIHFDLIVIGGGITGAGIALDATARGLKVALVEMQDFASGTSSRSTKLIHGGLRYLKQLEFKLVAEVGKERAIIHRVAPQLTRPEPMLLPITKNGSFGKISTRLGMWLYEWLAGVKREERQRVLNAEEALRAEPLLNKKGLLGGVLFYEYRTDDARLTLEVIKEAVNRGALALNYIKVMAFTYNNGKINGVQVEDQFTDDRFFISADYVVNATGPWVDELDQLDNAKQGNKLNITKGVHIVVDGAKLPVRQSLYMDAPDKRMVFVIPREGKTYIGTTDTFYKGDKTDPKITEEDKAYLLTCITNYFPSHPITNADIESGWAGLRPLINKPGKGPSEISRKDETFVWDSGLITIAGGKLTGYRKMAQRVVDLVATKIVARPDGGADRQRLFTCTTDHIALAGSGKDMTDFNAFVKNKTGEGQLLGLSGQQSNALIYRYGSNVSEVFRIIKEETQAGYSGVLPLFFYAQLLYAVEHELCTSPCDFFIRRTGALYFDIKTVRQWKEAVSKEMQRLLNYNDTLRDRLDAELQAALVGLSG